VKRFAQEQGVAVQGWSAFGMDGVIWLTGVERAILAAMTEPDFFGELVDIVWAWDRMRTELLLDTGVADLVVERGWYSSIEFWSPKLFRRFVLPHLQESSALAHQAGAQFAYTMTMGAVPLANELIEAGIDLLYYVDPVQDTTDLGVVKAKFAGRMAVAGGINSGVTLASGSPAEIREAVHRAVNTLAPGGGFILAPVDALFPDTPWASVQAMLDAWMEVRDYPRKG
jgi:uroporphyrinogen-III decarboxylase